MAGLRSVTGGVKLDPGTLAHVLEQYKRFAHSGPGTAQENELAAYLRRKYRQDHLGIANIAQATPDEIRQARAAHALGAGVAPGGLAPLAPGQHFNAAQAEQRPLQPPPPLVASASPFVDAMRNGGKPMQQGGPDSGRPIVATPPAPGAMTPTGQPFHVAADEIGSVPTAGLLQTGVAPGPSLADTLAAQYRPRRRRGSTYPLRGSVGFRGPHGGGGGG